MRKITEIELFISKERSKTYLDYFAKYSENKQYQEQKSYELYLWNIQMSGALLEVIGFYEVALRNTILKMLDKFYYPYGILSDAFIKTLSNTAGEEFIRKVNKIQHRLSPKKAPFEYRKNENGLLQPLRISGIPQGLIVADLTLSFWENMLTTKNKKRYWQRHFKMSFCYLENSSEIDVIHKNTQEIRKLRNRVCHHEPIINVEIEKIFSNLKNTLAYIGPKLVDVMNEFERVSHLLQSKPH